jgi:hypothetical protein
LIIITQATDQINHATSEQKLKKDLECLESSFQALEGPEIILKPLITDICVQKIFSSLVDFVGIIYPESVCGCVIQ